MQATKVYDLLFLFYAELKIVLFKLGCGSSSSFASVEPCPDLNVFFTICGKKQWVVPKLTCLVIVCVTAVLILQDNRKGNPMTSTKYPSAQIICVSKGPIQKVKNLFREQADVIHKINNL